MSLLVLLGCAVGPLAAARLDVQPLAGARSWEGRIVGGSEASLVQFPWQAGLLTTASRFFCGASIIDAEWILTAGHCVDPFKEFQVVVGAMDMPTGVESTRQTFTTEKKYIHPQYDFVFLDNDIGLLKLPRKIQFSLVVRAVNLPKYALVKDDLAGKVATVSGWGMTSDGSAASPVLKFASLNILPNRECEMIYGNIMTRSKLCLSAEDGNSVCRGDSGGALVLRDEGSQQVTQIGITSFVSSEGCEVEFPQGFTRVSSFLNYIEDVTGIVIGD